MKSLKILILLLTFAIQGVAFACYDKVDSEIGDYDDGVSDCIINIDIKKASDDEIDQGDTHNSDLKIIISTPNRESMPEDELVIINMYISNFLNIQEIVEENYESSWWAPSKDDVIAKITDFIKDMKVKTLDDYTFDEISELPNKVGRIMIVLNKACEKQFITAKDELTKLTSQAIDYKSKRKQ